MHSTWTGLLGSVLAIFLMVADSGVIDAQEIRVGRSVAVTHESESRRPVEPYLSVHPANPLHMLGAAITAVVAADWREMLSRQSCSAFVSLDGGQSWRQHEFAVPGCLDPWVTITQDGQGVFTAFAANRRGELVVFHSPDGGVTWEEAPAGLGFGHDHPTIEADWGAPERAGWVYVLSSQLIRREGEGPASVIHVARSRDGGRTFDAPVIVQPNNLRLKAEMPAVLLDGTLVLSYVEANEQDGTELIRRRAWVVRSNDGGRTFSRPTFVNEACGPPFRLSMLAADRSGGPFHDRLYFACNLPGESGVVLNHSQGGDDNWSAVVKVHSAAVDTTVRRKVMALAVNTRGVVGIAWTDGRHATPAADCYDVYFAASLDGGSSFLPERRVSESTSCPGTALNGAIGRIFAASGGDYIGMAGDVDGRFRLLWSDARNGTFHLRTSWVEVTIEAGLLQ
jgi:hypothetical protein